MTRVVDDGDIGIAGLVDEVAQSPPHVGDLEIAPETDIIEAR